MAYPRPHHSPLLYPRENGNAARAVEHAVTRKDRTFLPALFVLALVGCGSQGAVATAPRLPVPPPPQLVADPGAHARDAVRAREVFISEKDQAIVHVHPNANGAQLVAEGRFVGETSLSIPIVTESAGGASCGEYSCEMPPVAAAR